MARTPVLSQLLELVADEQSRQQLRTYFEPERQPQAPPRYTGSRFEQLGGGGDRAGVANRVSADDLVAVQMLSVRVPTAVALDLLEGTLGEEVAKHLADIAPDRSIGSAGAAALLADGGPADLAWHLLDDQDDMGWVIAGKLLARKRPALIPVYDRVTRCAYGDPPGFWLWLNGLFLEHDGALTAALAAQRDAAGISPAVTPLRVLDVILWMRHRNEHRASRCRGLAW